MSTLQHPHSSQVQKVIDALQRALPMAKAEGHLRMTCDLVNAGGHVCGTVHCHAGWLAIGLGLHANKNISYLAGREALSEIMGFIDGKKLKEWAFFNPEKWGNPYGLYMFSDEKAFKSSRRPHGALNLKHIIDHWKEVKTRLVALESPSRPDIRHSLAAVKSVEERLDVVEQTVKI